MGQLHVRSSVFLLRGKWRLHTGLCVKMGEGLGGHSGSLWQQRADPSGQAALGEIRVPRFRGHSATGISILKIEKLAGPSQQAVLGQTTLIAPKRQRLATGQQAPPKQSRGQSHARDGTIPAIEALCDKM